MSHEQGFSCSIYPPILDKIMDIKEFILDRRTIHNYNEKKVDEAIIQDALECFLHAPNHKHTKPWKVLITTRPQREKLIELKIKLKLEKKALSDIEIKAIQQKMSRPSHLLVILQKNCESAFQSKEDYAAISCAILNLQLYLWSKDIGSKWSSGKVTFHKETYNLLGIDPSEYSIVGFNWAGYYDRKPPKPPKQNYKEILI